jgi:hypothetical protein
VKHGAIEARESILPIPIAPLRTDHPENAAAACVPVIAGFPVGRVAQNRYARTTHG